MVLSIKPFQFACMLLSLILVGSMLDDVQANRVDPTLTVQKMNQPYSPVFSAPPKKRKKLNP